MDFKDRLQCLRKRNGYSQEMLAEAIGVSRQTVGKWETGQAAAGIAQLIALSELFGVSIDSLVKPDAQPCILLYQRACADLSSIIPFLLRAKRQTYAGKGLPSAPCRPASHDFTYSEGGLFYQDTYLGGERFAGEEAVWADGKPVWAMNYAGRLLGEGFSGDFLKEALLLGTPEAPWRGPAEYTSGDMRYLCRAQGCMEWFCGEEEIYLGHEKIYECRFHGGSIR